jgi:hypothetical protein
MLELCAQTRRVTPYGVLGTTGAAGVTTGAATFAFAVCTSIFVAVLPAFPST